MSLADLLNVCYVLLLEQVLDVVRAERQALMIAQVFSKNTVDLPDPDAAQRQLDAMLTAPLPVLDPDTTDLKRALGLTA